MTQEEIAQKIFIEVMNVQEQFGDEVAFAFLAGVKFAVGLQSEMLSGVLNSKEGIFSEAAVSLGEYYSNISKGEIS